MRVFCTSLGLSQTYTAKTQRNAKIAKKIEHQAARSSELPNTGKVFYSGSAPFLLASLALLGVLAVKESQKKSPVRSSGTDEAENSEVLRVSKATEGGDTTGHWYYGPDCFDRCGRFRNRGCKHQQSRSTLAESVTTCSPVVHRSG